MKKTMLKWVVLFSYIAMILFNTLADLLPINEVSTREISDLFPTLITPIPFTFYIWVIIYIFLGFFVLIQWIYELNPKDSFPWIESVFIINMIATILWQYAWHYLRIGESIIWTTLLLVTSIILLKLSQRLTITLKNTFGLYSGWLTIALIANIAVYLVSRNWDQWRLSQETWAFLILSIALGITLITVYKTKNIAYLVAIMWATLGILIRNIQKYPEGFETNYPYIIWITIVSLCTYLVMVIHYHPKPKKEVT